jgi:hypothetical protein
MIVHCLSSSEPIHEEQKHDRSNGSNDDSGKVQTTLVLEA